MPLPEAERGEKDMLALVIEGEHPQVPLIGEVIPKHGALLQEIAPDKADRDAPGQLRALGFAPGQKILQAQAQPVGRGDAGGIDPHPAAALEPDFAPGVRVRLMDDEVVADLVVLAAEIAGHHPRRGCRRGA